MWAASLGCLPPAQPHLEESLEWSSQGRRLACGHPLLARRNIHAAIMRQAKHALAASAQHDSVPYDSAATLLGLETVRG
jgi:hypothetical protein